MSKWSTNNRDRKTKKYHHIHLMLQLECSLEKETSKRDARLKKSQEYRQTGEI